MSAREAQVARMLREAVTSAGAAEGFTVLNGHTVADKLAPRIVAAIGAAMTGALETDERFQSAESAAWNAALRALEEP